MPLSAKLVKKLTRKRGFRIEIIFFEKKARLVRAKIGKRVRWEQSFTHKGNPVSNLRVNQDVFFGYSDERNHMIMSTEPELRVYVDRPTQRVYFFENTST